MRIQPGVPELRIEAPPELAALATRLARLDPSRLQGIARLVGLSEAGAPITMVLAPEESDVAKSTPPWVAGFARGADGLIVLFPARSPSYPYDSLEDVLRHEIAHVLIARAAGERSVPRWFNEGLALSAERPWGLEDRTRVAFALTGRRWSARELDRAFAGDQSEQARAYAVSGAFVRDLFRRHGPAAPARILKQMAAGDSFEIAFVRTTGETVATSEELFWRDSWWSQAVPFFTSTAVLWMVVTLLALLAIRTRRVRRAARRKAWEEEEQRQLPTDPPREWPREEPEEGPDRGPTIH